MVYFSLVALLLCSRLSAAEDASLPPDVTQEAPEQTAVRLLAHLQDKIKHRNAGQEEAASRERLEALERRGLELGEKWKPLKNDLAALRGQYAEEVDLGELAAPRSQARKQVDNLRKELLQIDQEYELAFRNFAIDALYGAMTVGKGQKAPRESSVDVAYVYHMDRIRKVIRGVLSATDAELGADEAAFHVALRAQESRRRLWRRLAALGGGGLATLVVWAWRNRRREQNGFPVPALLESKANGSSPGTETLVPGTVLGGNYRVQEELGRGSVGMVLKAEDLALKRSVAIKRLRQYARGGPREVERFLAEAQVVAGLRHPHIVQIHTLFKDGEDICLVFEHIAGQPLSEILAASGRLGLPDAKRIVIEVASALDYAHGQRVIHRDLKPSNIMIAADGEAKVMDFGLAHQARLTAARWTQAGGWGSPAYMSPEQELGTVSQLSDVYSLGVCFYEMITGQVPFPGPDFLAQKTKMSFLVPSRLIVGLPIEADEVVRRCLDARPESRFPTAGAFAEAVSRVPAAA